MTIINIDGCCEDGKVTTNTIDTKRLLPAGGTAGQVLAKASDADYSVAWADMQSGEIGAGQTWQDFTVSRNSGVTYTNTSDKTIVVSVCTYFNSNHTLTGFVDDMEISTQSTSVGNIHCSLVVPKGSTYKVAWNTTLVYWRELR